MPLSTSNGILTKVFPFSMGPLSDFTLSFIGAMGLYMYIFGYAKQFNILRFSYIRILLSFIEIIGAVECYVSDTDAVFSCDGILIKIMKVK